MTSLIERYTKSVMNTFGTPQAVLVKGQGAEVEDDAGNQYLDFLGGIAVNALGHAHPAVVRAVTEQLSTLGHVSNLFASEPQIQLAERLTALLAPEATARVFLTNSGAEAVEAAFKLTRLTGRTKVVCATGSFHGRTMGALALTSKAAYREPFEPLPGGVEFVPYGDEAALAAAVDDQTAAVLLEPIQGEAGVIVPPDGYLATARRITTEHGALLWLDEIQTGIGRTGRWFAAANDVAPDIVTLAKGLGGGIPIGACVGIGQAADLFQPGQHGTTFGGNPVAAAAALAVLDEIENAGLLEHCAAIGAKLQAGIAGPRVAEIRGAGLLIGLDLTRPVGAEVVRAARAAGFLLNSPRPESIRLAPPLNLTESQADRLLAAWPAILDAAFEGTT